MQDALPNAPPPEQQTVRSLPIWYTTLGRLLDVPSVSWASATQAVSGPHVVETAAQRMTDELCGLQTVVDRLWYVWEVDMMALAMNGTWHKRDAPLAQHCS